MLKGVDFKLTVSDLQMVDKNDSEQKFMTKSGEAAVEHLLQAAF